MQPKSNAKFIGHIIGDPLNIVSFDLSEQEPFNHQSSVPLGDMMEDEQGPQEQDPCDLAHDYNAMTEGSDAPTEYDPSL